MKLIIISIIVTVGIYYIGMFMLPFLIPFFFGAWFIKYLLSGEHDKTCKAVESGVNDLIKQFETAKENTRTEAN